MGFGAVDDDYARLFRAEFPRVRRTVRLIVHDAVSAEDLTQDAFVQLLLHWRKVSRFDRPDAWVRRVAIRLAVRHLKRENRRVLVEGTLAPGAPWPGPDPDVINAVRALPPKQQAVLVLFYYEDRPMAEIADLLDISESTGFVHLHRARRTLAAALGEVLLDASR
jgi:DNA-directed RNA polymerase specialized sigma24 family protein